MIGMNGSSLVTLVTVFPVSKVQLGRDLGAAIDIGPVVDRKIMKANCEVMYRTSVMPHTPEEMVSPVRRNLDH
jgi:hypothetical protein